MIRNALRLSRDQKRDRSIEMGAMDDSGEPLRQGFETVEGIEMVPGTVHLVDSELIILAKTVEKPSERISYERSLLCSSADSPQCKGPPASSIELATTKTSF
jgi:hypothetical protein